MRVQLPSDAFPEIMGKTLSDTLKKTSPNEKKKLLRVVIISVSVGIAVSFLSFLIFSSVRDSKGSESKIKWEEVMSDGMWIYSSGDKTAGYSVEFPDSSLMRCNSDGGYTEYTLSCISGDDYMTDTHSIHFSVNTDDSYLMTVKNGNKTGYYKKKINEH